MASEMKEYIRKFLEELDYQMEVYPNSLMAPSTIRITAPIDFTDTRMDSIALGREELEEHIERFFLDLEHSDYAYRSSKHYPLLRASWSVNSRFREALKEMVQDCRLKGSVYHRRSLNLDLYYRPKDETLRVSSKEAPLFNGKDGRGKTLQVGMVLLRIVGRKQEKLEVAQELEATLWLNNPEYWMTKDLRKVIRPGVSLGPCELLNFFSEEEFDFYSDDTFGIFYFEPLPEYRLPWKVFFYLRNR